MTPTAILLITISAFIHAFWNFLSKRNNPSIAFFLIASVVSTVLTAPLLVIYRRGLAFLTPTGWALIVGTGACETLYYVGLSGAYLHGDLSLTYPLVRALPVLLVPLVSLALGRGDQIGRLAFAGFGLVACGCLILPLPSFVQLRWKHYLKISLLFAALAAAGATGYTLIDDQVMRNLRTASGITLVNTQITLLYMALINLSLTISLGFYILTKQDEVHSLISSWKSYWRSAAWAGLMITGGYLLVLLAMAFVSNVSYVYAFRQLSLPIGVFLAMIVHREPRYIPRLVGLGIILVGLILITLG